MPEDFDGESPVRTDADSDHVLLYTLAQPHAGIKTLLDNVAEGAVQKQLDADVGIGAENRLQLRPGQAAMCAANVAAWTAAVVVAQLCLSVVFGR